VDERTHPDEQDEDTGRLGLDKELEDLGMGQDARRTVVGALEAGVELGVVPSVAGAAVGLGCLRPVIVIA